jgi:Family of unknown function (DUF6491)
MKRALMVMGIVGLAALAQACATEAAKDSKATGLDKPEATIPFINMRSSILTWQADGENGLWLQDSRRQWYYAKMFSPCIGLEFAVQLGIKNTTMNQLDRYSEIVVPDEHMGPCQFRSLVKSDPPPKGKEHKPSEEKEKPVK